MTDILRGEFLGASSVPLLRSSEGHDLSSRCIFWFPICRFVSKPERSKASTLNALKALLMSKIEAKFHTFWPPVKIRGRMGKIYGWSFSARPGAEPLIYFFDGTPLGRLGYYESDWQEKNTEVKQKTYPPIAGWSNNKQKKQ